MNEQLTLFDTREPEPISIMERTPDPDDMRTWDRKYISPVKNRETHHAARYTNSKRLQRVMAVLSDGRWHDCFALGAEARVTNPAGAISELRNPKNNLNIENDPNHKGRYGRWRWVR